MKRICVFCGSRVGARPDYGEAALRLAGALARRGLSLVYGGGDVGLMGVIANEMLRIGGHVAGVIPHSLVRREVGHRALTETFVVDTMHERTAKMAELADGFIALPGGLGTLEEIFEIWTWAQLGVHAKPCGFLNVAGYYDPLLAFLDHAVEESFVAPEMRAVAVVSSDPDDLLERFLTYRPPSVRKWIDHDET
jgi:uncharacterized protein (TIGR00730 family)